MRATRLLLPAVGLGAAAVAWRATHGGILVATLIRFRWALRRLEAELDHVGDLGDDAD